MFANPRNDVENVQVYALPREPFEQYKAEVDIGLNYMELTNRSRRVLFLCHNLKRIGTYVRAYH